ITVARTGRQPRVTVACPRRRPDLRKRATAHLLAPLHLIARHSHVVRRGCPGQVDLYRRDGCRCKTRRRARRRRVSERGRGEVSAECEITTRIATFDLVVVQG